MGNQIISKPEAIREAANSIANLDNKTSYSKFPTHLTSSKGLVAEEIYEIIEELTRIDELVAGILKKFPKKLNSVASIIEESDNAAANLFK